jgi:putative sigma-54 modulation protein
VNVSVVARHMDVTEAMKRYAEEKAGRLPRFYDAVRAAVVTLDKDAGEFLVEIVVTGRRKSVFVAHHRGTELHACLDQCIHKLTEQLRRHKDRVRDRQGPGHQETMLPEPPPET